MVDAGEWTREGQWLGKEFKNGLHDHRKGVCEYLKSSDDHRSRSNKGPP
jgi:hypothetical protein